MILLWLNKSTGVCQHLCIVFVLSSIAQEFNLVRPEKFGWSLVIPVLNIGLFSKETEVLNRFTSPTIHIDKVYSLRGWCFVIDLIMELQETTDPPLRPRWGETKTHNDIQGFFYSSHTLLLNLWVWIRGKEWEQELKKKPWWKTTGQSLLNHRRNAIIWGLIWINFSKSVRAFTVRRERRGGMRTEFSEDERFRTLDRRVSTKSKANVVLVVVM